MRYNPWQVLIASGAVEDEIKALPTDMQARYLRLLDLIEQHGPASLGMPHARKLDDELWELRITGRDGIARAIYFATSGRRVVILHVFVKKTQKTPRRALETARQRMKVLDL